MFHVGDKMFCKRNVPGVPDFEGLLGSTCIYVRDHGVFDFTSHLIRKDTPKSRSWYVAFGELNQYFSEIQEEEVI